MITSITIGDKAFFKVGEKIKKGEEETEIICVKIKVRFGKIKVYFSDGEVLTYRGYNSISS